MIHRAKFMNFKALRDVEITFDSRLTVLVGPNGSGKTSVLQGLLFLCQVAEFGPTEGTDFNVGDLAQFLSRSAAAPSDMTLEAVARSSDDTATKVQICPSMEDNGTLRRFHGYTTQVSVFKGGKKRWEKVGEVAPMEVIKDFRAAVLLRLDSKVLAAPSQPEEVPPRLKPNGKGLASVLAYLALNQPERFASVIDVFRKVISSVSRVRFDKVKSEQFSDTLLFDFVGAPGVPSAHVSTGTLFALGLVTAILGPNGPRVLLLDDLDHGLHPTAQIELVEALRSLLEHNPELQIIATSHSPYILDKLAWNEVRVTSLQDDGSAICKPLVEHPQYPKWKESMSPGEFWSHSGEDWVKESNHQAVVT